MHDSRPAGLPSGAGEERRSGPIEDPLEASRGDGLGLGGRWRGDRQWRIEPAERQTSALDSEAKRVTRSNMDRLLKGRTAFVIAHRLTTIRDADLICVLEQGQIVEQGTDEELLKRQGLYAYLQAQQLDR
jgi:hypothetical protein